jgi:FMN phosphatase YigB (HAD superfamily)
MTARAASHEKLTFLLDVDNTLLNNDLLKTDIARDLEDRLGRQRATRFWELYEEVREDEDFVDYPRTVERLGEEYHDPDMTRDLRQLLRTFPFRRYLYPHVLETIAHLKTMGTVVILSDGDTVFQPLKIRESGLADAVDGHVLIYVHKEDELDAVFAAYPADHYVMVDDKARILAALETCCPTEFTTVLVCQGKYAHLDASPKPDHVIEHIADLRRFTRQQFFAAG